MKYLIVQDWQSTHGNHAGMVHMCMMLKEKWPEEYEVFVKASPKSSKPITGNWLKRKLVGKYRYYKGMYYKKYTCLQNYLSLCQPMFEKLKEGDEVFLLEYLLPDEPQYGLAMYIRKKFPFVRIYALSHLTKSYFEQSIVKKTPNIVYEWSKPIDVMLTLGTSLTRYFIEKNVPVSKLSTGFHYVDSAYYKKQQPVESHSPLRVIMMGALQRDYGMFSEIVKQCPDIHWIICRGRKNVDDLFPKTPNVELKGFLEEDELRHQMDIADVSLNVLEDTVGSNVITTSLAMGLAMVVSDVGSIRDYCDSDNALFCTNNVQQFVQAIKKLQGNPALVQQMKESSLEKSKRLQIDNVHRWFLNLK